MIKGATQFFGLIGYPVTHSLSPYIHNYIFKKCSRDAYYGCFQTHNLRQAVKGMSALGFGGFNVTIPFKEKIIPYLDRTEHTARIMEAVNTVHIEKGKLIGYNTDGEGFLHSLKHFRFTLSGKNVAILGAGGAAKAVAVSLAQKNVKGIFLYDIFYRKAQLLAQKIKRSFPQVNVEACKEKKCILLDEADLLVNATGVGLRKSDPLPLVLKKHKRRLLVYDLLYHPLRPKLLLHARAKGLRTINGLWMLIYQALEAQKIWFGIECKRLARPLHTQLTKKGKK